MLSIKINLSLIPHFIHPCTTPIHSVAIAQYIHKNMNNNTNKSSNHSIFVDPPSCDVINGVTSLAVTPSAINPAAASRASGQAL